ncbi:unnamed protein product, partial [Prorocentrum cordatum]
RRPAGWCQLATRQFPGGETAVSSEGGGEEGRGRVPDLRKSMPRRMRRTCSCPACPGASNAGGLRRRGGELVHQGSGHGEQARPGGDEGSFQGGTPRLRGALPPGVVQRRGRDQTRAGLGGQGQGDAHLRQLHGDGSHCHPEDGPPGYSEEEISAWIGELKA